MMTPILRLFGTATLCSCLASCGGVTAAPAATPLAASTLKQQLQAEIGDAACTATSQCRTVAVGHKACGGPEAYLAWSSARSDGATIARLGAALAAESQAQTLRNGMISTCSLVLDPGATCQQGHCVPGPSGPAAR